SYGSQEERSEENFWLSYGQIAVDEPKQNNAHAVTRIEPDPGTPHRGVLRDDRRDLAHANSQFWISWKKLRAEEREYKMHQAKDQRHTCAQRHQDSGPHHHKRTDFDPRPTTLSPPATWLLDVVGRSYEPELVFQECLDVLSAGQPQRDQPASVSKPNLEIEER